MAQSQSAERRLTELWIGLRLFTLGWALFFSPIRPMTEREQKIAMWPPSPPYTVWAERVVFAPWERWDAKYFAESVKTGWSSDNGTSQFHPLLPLLAKPFAIFLPPMVALMLVASAASLLAVLALYRLARLDLPETEAEVACVLFLAFPVSAIMFAPYTEPLFIAAAALTLLWSRQRRWLAVAAATAVATLSRQQGLFLVLPVAWELWESRERHWRGLVALGAAPAAYLAWVVYRGFALGDLRPDYSSFNALVYSTLLSPSSVKVVSVQYLLPPWESLYRGAAITFAEARLNNTLNLVLGGVFLLMTAVAWKHMRGSYRVFTAALVLLSFALYTGPEIPYMGLPRHLLLAIPVFIGMAPVLAKGKRRVIAGALFFPANLLVVLMYVLEAWVP